MMNSRDQVSSNEALTPAEDSANPHLVPVQNQPHQEQLATIDRVDSTDYRMEAARLESYENWPLSFMEPSRPAAAGFYYTGDGDKVKCFECQVEICQWAEGDNPMADHQRWSGRCR